MNGTAPKLIHHLLNTGEHFVVADGSLYPDSKRPFLYEYSTTRSPEGQGMNVMFGHIESNACVTDALS